MSLENLNLVGYSGCDEYRKRERAVSAALMLLSAEARGGIRIEFSGAINEKKL